MPPRRTKNAFKKESFRQNYFFNLNDEELAMIFKYLKDLKHVSLVCKKFHKVVVSMIQGKQWLWIKNEEDIEDELLYKSIMKSKLVLSNVAIGESAAIKPVERQDFDDFLCENWYYKAVLTVIGQHSPNIIRLQLMNLKIAIGHLEDLLSFADNLKMLFLFFINNNNDEKPDLKRFYLGESLPKVTDVVIYECGDSILWILAHLPADCIQSLTIKTNSFDILKVSLAQQAMIRKLNLISDGNEVLPKNFFENLDLTHLILKTSEVENLPAIISSNRSLISLDVGDIKINNEAFFKIAQLPRLESLVVNCSGISREIFISLERMPALTKLSLKNSSAMHFEVASSLKSSLRVIQC